MTINTPLTEQHLKNRLLRAYQYFSEIKHEKNIARIKQLARKLSNHEFGIAFAGHFSAGKSRMINNLCGAELLPSSPIPTSANLVRVHAGREEYARVYFKEGKTRKYLAPYDYDMVRSFCRDGDQVTVIELSHRSLTLPEQVVVMDTPGIDSADDAHRMATEDAIHMADVIFYVMDYNHVQSELNFTFTRELTKAGKEVYLVVNQIDKHREGELSFATFAESTSNAFKGWGVEPAGIFFTSLKELNHPENQFSELQSLMWRRIDNRSQLLVESVYASLQKICDEYQAEIEAQGEAEGAEAKAALAALSEEKLAQVKADFAELTTEKKSLKQEWENDFNKGITKILDNAYLMPTATRDKGASYLESCQPNFKVGFFFNTKKKTEEERIRRQDIFFTDVRDKIRSQVEWHIKTYLLEFAKNHNINQQEFLQKIQGITIEPTAELFSAAMRDGAKLTQDGSYVMNYCGNVAEGIKTITRGIVKEFRDSMKQILAERGRVRTEEIDRQLAEIAEFTGALEILNKQEENARKVSADMAELLSSDVEITAGQEIFAAESIEEDVVTGNGEAIAKQTDENTVETEVKLMESKAAVQSEGNITEHRSEADSNEPQGTGQLKAMAGTLKNTAALVGQLPSMKRMAQELNARAERLENKGFMVTLFGAFSAGKSSFANSLLGERLLPVSPNPTTAAINKIMPVDKAHPHGTVLVKLKDEDMLLADVNRAFAAFGMKVNSLEEVGNYLGRALADSRVNRQRQKSFLRAFQQGYRHLSQDLGQVLHKELADFPAFAAEEDKSCFVEWIEVYYDCEFTRQGITLVDTPGADSINARHTDMSFNFIRQSDVILFVTYYNHAFSRADREFLIQLGRVKDAFQLDKMFFIVNAIDLAENEEEAEGVVEYVRQQLRNYGVSRPQLHPLSSQQILEEKLSGKTGRYPFEEAFYSFVFHDLTSIAINLAEQEQQRAETLVDELIKASQEDVAVKEKRKELLHQHKQQAGEILSALAPQELINGMNQEMDELLYYVKQRVFLRFLDFFRESFNPADLRASGDTDKLLRESLHQLLENIGFDLAQELRATTLRLENYLQRSVSRWRINLMNRLREIDREITVTRPKIEFEAGLEYKTAFQQTDTKPFNSILGTFRNPRQFFEEGGSKRMAEELEKMISSLADEYLSGEKERIAAVFDQGVEKVFAVQVENIKVELDEFYAGHLSALEGGVATEVLLDIRQKISQ